MVRFFFALTALFLTCTATFAQNIAREYLDEIEAAHADITAVFYNDTAPLTMHAELRRRGASYALEQGYADSWGGHVYFGASNISTFYHVARRQMLSWMWAVDRGDLDNSTAALLLAEPMAVFRMAMQNCRMA